MQPYASLTFLVRLLLTVVLLACFGALLPVFTGPGAAPADVVRVIVGMCGTFCVCYVWAPRVVARAVKFVTE